MKCCFSAHHLKCMIFYFSRAIANRAMDHMPNLLLLTAVTPRQHLQLEATLSSSNNSMGPRMVNQHKVSDLNGTFDSQCHSARNYI